MNTSDTSPRVSVIIPTYNRPAFLQQAMESVQGQTFKDVEILVIDDGSTGDTCAVVEAIMDPRIRYIRQENAGRSAARNHGLGLARGEFIAFLDDDDLYLPHKLAMQVAFLESQPAVDLVGAGTQMIDEQGRLSRVWRTWEEQPELRLPACLYACPLPTCTVLFRRRTLDRLDHWFDPALDRAEDTDFFVRLLLTGCRMAWLPEIVSAYRFHPANSQSDGAHYGRSHQRLLDQVFARTDLPASVLAERERIYAQHYLADACHAYATGQIAEGQAGLVRAIALQPDLTVGSPPALAAAVAAFARSDIVKERREFIETVFAELPPELAHLRGLRGSCRSAFHMQQVFSAHGAGQPIPLNDWLRGIFCDPRWLRNRGVWSILRDALLSRTRAGTAG